MKGFTLLELLIAIVILTFISAGVYKTTASSFTLRENLDRDGDFYNNIRIALDVMGRDIAHMYSPQAAALPGDVGKAAADDPAKQGQGGANAGAFMRLSAGTGMVWPFWSPAINPFGVRPARFTGEPGKITFISDSNMRVFRDAQESDFLKVTYAFEEDPRGARGEKALVRRTRTDVFAEREDPDEETRYVLLPRVKALKFSFLDGEKDRWDLSPSWDTSDGSSKGVYPAMIRVEIEVYTPQSKENTFFVSQLYRPELNL